MKKTLKLTALLLAAVLAVALVGCNKFEYEMADFKTGDFHYSIPDHFEYAVTEDADDFYVTMNSSVAVYAYTHSEFDAVFGSYGGDYSAGDVAEYIVELREYNAAVYDGAVAGSARYSFLYTDGEATYYNHTTVHTNDKSVYVLVFSCNADKLELYQDMILDIIDSAHIESED